MTENEPGAQGSLEIGSRSKEHDSCDLTTTAQGRFLDVSRKEHLERARDGQVVSTRTAVTTLQKLMSPP